MTVSLAKLPADISVGALVTYNFDTAKNPSEGGVSSRKSMRNQVIRQYMVTTLPGAPSVEFQNVVLSVLGQRYPFAMRDWTSYKLANEPQPIFLPNSGGGTMIPLYKVFEPLTGVRTYIQRILVPDTSEVPLVFNLNGSPITPTIVDPGIAVVPGTLTQGVDDFRIVSGQYLVPVCIVDQPAATIIGGRDPTGAVLYQFKDVRLEEILENELIALVAS